MDIHLPFGLMSAPYLFNQLLITIDWILQYSYGVQHILHYFFTAGQAHLPQCSEKLQAMLNLCSDINDPIKQSKVKGPTTSLTFLGIHLNSAMMKASILDETKHALLKELQWMHHRDKCTSNNCYLLSVSCHSVAKYSQPEEYFYAQ